MSEEVKETGPVVKGYFVPGLPHILLAPDANPNWMKVRKAFDTAREEIEATDADVMVIYSTYWASVVGHQIQADPEPEWVHVDEQFHDLGNMPYKFKMDTELAEAYRDKCEERGLWARTINYQGFPIDTGSIVALKLLNPNNRIPAIIVSSNIYSDRAETVVLGKALNDALKALGKKAVCVSVSSLSNRLFTETIDPKDDRIYSLKDEEWNQKFLEFFAEGRLEDLSQLSRQFHKEARVTKKVNNFKPIWWLAAAMGETNNYIGNIFEYQPILGTGAAVVGLTPAEGASKDLEFDEDDAEVYGGDRNVLGTALDEVGDEPEDKQT